MWLLGQALILGGHLFCCLLLLLIEGCTLSIDLSLNEKSLIYNNREEVKSLLAYADSTFSQNVRLSRCKCTRPVILAHAEDL